MSVRMDHIETEAYIESLVETGYLSASFQGRLIDLLNSDIKNAEDRGYNSAIDDIALSLAPK